MRKVLLFALVALLALPLMATAAPKLKFGVTIEKFNDVFMRYALDQLTDEATKNNIDVITGDAKGDPNEQLKIVENFITQGVDAILSMSSYQPDDRPHDHQGVSRGEYPACLFQSQTRRFRARGGQGRRGRLSGGRRGQPGR